MDTLKSNSARSTQRMDFDNMLEELGEMGKFQIRTYILVCLPVLFAGANSLSYVFTAGVPNYRCLVPECDRATAPNYDEPWMDYAVPESPNNVQNYFQPSQCQQYLANATIANGTCFRGLFTRDVVQCKEWVFDSERTIVNEWNITCLENQWKLSLIGTSHFAGIIAGSGFFGFLADKYGRKNVFIVCTVIMSLSGMAQILAPDYVTFVVLIFVHALGTSGIYPTAFILGVELVGKKKRELTGIVLNYFYAVGEALVALIAWLALNWKVLQFTVAAPALLFITYYWFVTESVRWLLAKEKNNKAKGIVFKVAKVNNVKLSALLLESFETEEHPRDDAEKSERTNDILPTLRSILKSRTLIVRYLIIFYVWIVNAFVYYGLSLNATSMSGDKYLNFAFVCLIEIPGYTLSWIAIHKLGRRPSLIASLLLCGVTCCLSLVVGDITWLSTILFLIGKCGVTSAFSIVYVYTAELFPTIIRSGGVGTASTISRFGALLAPFVPLLGLYVSYLPMILFGTIAISAGLLAFKLPETLGNKLPETVEEAKLIG